jgi:hypothetical protein
MFSATREGLDGESSMQRDGEPNATGLYRVPVVRVRVGLVPRWFARSIAILSRGDRALRVGWVLRPTELPLPELVLPLHWVWEGVVNFRPEWNSIAEHQRRQG